MRSARRARSSMLCQEKVRAQNERESGSAARRRHGRQQGHGHPARLFLFNPVARQEEGLPGDGRRHGQHAAHRDPDIRATATARERVQRQPGSLRRMVCFRCTARFAADGLRRTAARRGRIAATRRRSRFRFLGCFGSDAGWCRRGNGPGGGHESGQQVSSQHDAAGECSADPAKSGSRRSIHAVGVVNGRGPPVKDAVHKLNASASRLGLCSRAPMLVDSKPASCIL